MTGDALYWLQWVLRRSPDLSWPQFTKDLLIHFGDNSTTIYYEAWGSTQQTGSLEDYVSSFIVRSAQDTKFGRGALFGTVFNWLTSSYSHEDSGGYHYGRVCIY